jgi:mRNA-degrading endonuclease RelE of RelBE toxin-antitoxin system
MASVVLTLEAQAQVDKLPLGIRYRVQDVIERLKDWPMVSGTKWLQHAWKGHARIRVGDWRVIFKVVGDVVVVRIAHRSEVYE